MIRDLETSESVSKKLTTWKINIIRKYESTVSMNIVTYEEHKDKERYQSFELHMCSKFDVEVICVLFGCFSVYCS